MYAAPAVKGLKTTIMTIVGFSVLRVTIQSDNVSDASLEPSTSQADKSLWSPEALPYRRSRDRLWPITAQIVPQETEVGKPLWLLRDSPHIVM